MTRHVMTDFSGDEFVGCDLSGATFRESEFAGTRIIGSFVDGLSIESFAGELEGPVYVDGIDVAPYVIAELDRQFPERVLARDASTAAQFQAVWPMIRDLWEGTIDRASALGPGVVDESVDGEWSFIQTLRHLILALDTWVGHMLMNPPSDWHPWGWPFLGFSQDAADEIGLDLAATPSLTEVAEALRGRWERLDAQLVALTDESLAEEITARADPERELTETREHCLHTILNELVEHRRYAVRDLDRLTVGAAESGASA